MMNLLLPVLVLLLIGISIPLVLGKVPPNDLYGFRTSKTMSNSVIWYEANRRAGINLIVASVLTLAAWGAVAMGFGLRSANIAASPILLVMALGSTAVSFLQLKKM